MKQKVIYYIGFLLIFSMLLVCSSCGESKTAYYSQRENYISATGTIEYIHYNDQSSALYLEFSELQPAFDDICFKIVGENLLIVKNNGIDSKLQIGDKVTFISAPKYFGDGYVFPIVALSVNETSLLEFEEGVSNLLTWLKS